MSEPLITSVCLVNASSTTLVAASLASSKLVGATFSIAALPSCPACAAPSLVVAALILPLASFAASVTCLIKSCFSLSLRLSEPLITSVCLVNASSTTLVAAFLASSKLVGTTFSIAALPSCPACAAPSLVVAELILSLASFAASVTCLIKSCFSLSLRLSEPLITSVCLVSASSTTLVAAFLASSKLGTLTLLILVVPSSCAFLIASAVVALSIASLAALAASVASLINLSFSS
ncbi:hypothetical protein FC46_GL001643 [Lactobacillus kalixensis DSM 16043]|uniref:Uncharacterized protein n=1 Tax=Lactobacillus kalixensis DSM 16043 TaxID=1423763 RepID=A0A0R1UE55_9LACO|nr:hypothetical protein FC46_GL001643 [Lactobacillus kalixensis DSM 16043]